ncbi:MAG: hypothetical protein JSV65_13920 [Armatimonadota bacterium]|nr:MAG: hypothetical protein JSV65_13920 [Armatimonadota bacterium]
MFDDRAIADYLRRCYVAVDGLWFMKVEERLDFDEALRLDVAVWRVLGKIQARKAQEVLRIQGRALADLMAALSFKWQAEQLGYRIVSQQPNRAEIEFAECPWIELLRKSNREHLAARVADAICPTEYTAWAREFDPTITVSWPERMCDGKPACRLVLEIAQQPVSGADERG